MPTVHFYADPVLARHVTEEREQRAIADVATLGDFPEPWPATLQRARAYVVTCHECMSAPNDIFDTKLAAYRRDYESALASAKDARAAAAAGAPLGTKRPAFGFVDLERG
jgi:hypothetical protein